MSLPWRNPRHILHNNFNLCLKRLKGLLSRLRSEKNILREYDSVIRAQVEQGVVEPSDSATEADVTGVHYLSHYAVIRTQPSECNASAMSNGVSLNECLHAGPKFDQRIFDINKLQKQTPGDHVVKMLQTWVP